MIPLRPADLSCSLGYDCSGLLPAAHALERSPEFKRAAADDFTRVLDLWRQDRSFTAPFTAPVRPTKTPKPDPHGDVDPIEVLDFVREHVTAHARGSRTIEPDEADSAKCVWDPVHLRWINIGGYHLDVDGRTWTADRAVDDFEVAYRAARPSVPADFDVLCGGLRAMPVVLFVSWPVAL